MLAAAAAAIASRAVAERTRYGRYILTSLLIMAFIYSVYGSWVWGGYFGGEGLLAK